MTEEISLFEDLYKIIYLDSPWKYNSRCTWSKTRFGGGVHRQYKTLPVPEIAEITYPFIQQSDKDCAIFAWATFPNLPMLFELIREWNFKIIKEKLGKELMSQIPFSKTIKDPYQMLAIVNKLKINKGRISKKMLFKYRTIGFIWVKTNPKSGTPFFGTGYYAKSNSEPCFLITRGKMKPVSNKVSSVIISPRREHSKKPDEVREKIVELFGDIPRIELFARQRYPGWESWGDQLEALQCGTP